MTLARRWCIWVLYVVAIGTGLIGATALWDALSS